MYRNNNFGRRFHSTKSFRPQRQGRKTPVFNDVSKFINRAKVVAELIHVPKNTFLTFGIDKRLEKNILDKGYTIPTPIQDESISHIIAGRDIVGIANTGTGKTAAFVIPLLNKVILNRNEKIMIVAPTRELAIQINQEILKFSSGLAIFCVNAVGGMPIYRQIGDLKRKHNIVIGTPGRIKDLIDRRCIKMADFHTIVLDEADRMLDMGFIADMRSIIGAMLKDRQILFFSATMSSDIKKIIGDFLKNPVSITVKTRDTASAVDQDVLYVGSANKLDILHDLLKKPEFCKVLIFGRTKHGVERLSDNLNRKGIKATSIHGNKNHSQRQTALRSFKDDSIKVLLATDVASRGLDIPDVSHVINFELPNTYEDYIHRIGRTGRAGKAGKALTFIER